VCSKWFVPGDATIVYAWLKLGANGARLDCFVQIRSEVLYANCLDMFVISLLLRSFL
jgi:hypothetical protein